MTQGVVTMFLKSKRGALVLALSLMGGAGAAQAQASQAEQALRICLDLHAHVMRQKAAADLAAQQPEPAVLRQEQVEQSGWQDEGTYLMRCEPPGSKHRFAPEVLQAQCGSPAWPADSHALVQRISTEGCWRLRFVHAQGAERRAFDQLLAKRPQGDRAALQRCVSEGGALLREMAALQAQEAALREHTRGLDGDARHYVLERAFKAPAARLMPRVADHEARCEAPTGLQFKADLLQAECGPLRWQAPVTAQLRRLEASACHRVRAASWTEAERAANETQLRALLRPGETLPQDWARPRLSSAKP
jgi:hypothetical protein